MKKAFQHSISVAMAFLVLFSTFSFTVDKHFCGSFLVDKAIFLKRKPAAWKWKLQLKIPAAQMKN